MLRIVKFGGLTLTGGLVIGLGVVGWLWLHRSDTTTVNSRGGIVSLDDSPAPSPGGGDLKVAQSVDEGVGTVLSAGAGGASSNGVGGSSGGVGNSSTGASAGDSTGNKAALPGPDEFEQYEQYKDGQSALYGDIRLGSGDEVKVGSVVTVNYRGWLTNGTLFDESYSRGQAFTFTEGEHRVISGWEQGLLGMKAGGKRRLIVPSAYGYGAEGHDPIPPNSMLIFDVELVSATSK